MQFVVILACNSVIVSSYISGKVGKQVRDGWKKRKTRIDRFLSLISLFRRIVPSRLSKHNWYLLAVFRPWKKSVFPSASVSAYYEMRVDSLGCFFFSSINWLFIDWCIRCLFVFGSLEGSLFPSKFFSFLFHQTANPLSNSSLTSCHTRYRCWRNRTLWLRNANRNMCTSRSSSPPG